MILYTYGGRPLTRRQLRRFRALLATLPVSALAAVCTAVLLTWREFAGPPPAWAWWAAAAVVTVAVLLGPVGWLTTPLSDPAFDNPTRCR